MRRSLVLQTPGKPFTHELQCHPFSNSSNPSCEWSGMAAFLRGTLTSIETPTTIFDFCCFIYIVTIITRKLQLVDRLMNKITRGMYLALC